jgi:DNA (cytosine-5)-methyltransferase 1
MRTPVSNPLMASSKNVKVIDLFAGAGGFSVGAHEAGASVAASLELDHTACDTLRANPGYHGEVIEGDISDFSGQQLRTLAGIKRGDRLIIVGGPPCQPFSKAAYWTEEGNDAAYRRARAEGKQVAKPDAPTAVKDDSRRDLVKQFWRIVAETKADGFVFENVPSIKHPRNRPIYDSFVLCAKAAGYEIAEAVANAAEYGVAQTRERVIVVGSRRGRPMVPRPSHSLGGGTLPYPVTAGEALAGFDTKKYFEPEEVITGRWAKHLEEVPPGWNYKAHTAWANHPNPTFVTETRFWNFLLKLSKNRPSWTLAASPGPWTGPFHWDNRRLRTPEMAALQGFPRGYTIAGPRRERVRQMGNAIPVPLARAAVRSVLESME